MIQLIATLSASSFIYYIISGQEIALAAWICLTLLLLGFV